MYHPDSGPDVVPTPVFPAVPIISAAFRVVSSSVTCLVGFAIYLGLQARAPDRTTTDLHPEIVRVERRGSKPHVSIAIPSGENAAHFVVCSPTGEDLFEVSGFRDGHVDVRCRTAGATLSSSPKGRVDIYLRQHQVKPRIAVSDDQQSVSLSFAESRADSSPAQIRVALEGAPKVRSQNARVAAP